MKEFFIKFRNQGYQWTLVAWWIGFGVLITIIGLIGGKPFLETLAFGFSFSLLLPLIILPISFWWENTGKRNHIEKLFHHPTFQQLQKIGFKKVGPELQGVYKNMDCRICWIEGNPNKKSKKLYAVEVTILLDNLTNSDHVEIKALKNSHSFFLNEGTIQTYIDSGRTKLPDLNKILNALDLMANVKLKR